ncbi:MAG: hypothetical protein GF317_17075 [Candidatus Lokiarchaeota archaeon]|nr:hypothetical protein [Candidatus Lokiarchaeota archaeon]
MNKQIENIVEILEKMLIGSCILVGVAYEKTGYTSLLYLLRSLLVGITTYHITWFLLMSFEKINKPKEKLEK